MKLNQRDIKTNKKESFVPTPNDNPERIEQHLQVQNTKLNFKKEIETSAIISTSPSKSKTRQNLEAKGPHIFKPCNNSFATAESTQKNEYIRLRKDIKTEQNEQLEIRNEPTGV